MRAGEGDVVILDEPAPPGMAEGIKGGRVTTDFVAKIYVPDVEQRWGWREFYVLRDETPKPGYRPVGFRKPGAP